MLLSTLAVYVPLAFKDFSIVARHYDGPFYMYIAKTFYVIPPDHPFHQHLPASFYAGQFPMYPILIRLLTLFTLGNYPAAMVLATLSSSIGAVLLFYKLLQSWELVRSPIWTSVLFCFFPERWLMQHVIGSTEPLFFCLIFGAFISYKQKRDLLVFLCITLACLTRPPGFLMVPIFGFFYLRHRRWKTAFLIPFTLSGLLLLFLYHQYVFGDFLAAFRMHTTMAFASSSTQRSSINSYPLAIYRFYAERPSFHSTELFLLLYVLSLIGTLALWKKKEFFFYSLVYLLFTFFVFSFDLPRYLLPIAPFAYLVAFDEILSHRAFRFIVFPLFLYLAYTFVLGFLPLATCSPETFRDMLHQIRTLP